MEQQKVLDITTEKQLRTYMHPLRQKILFELSICPAGMTAKQLADKLGVAPSSAGHHLAELEKLGLAELAHTEVIHGFTAKFYRAADVEVNIHSQSDAGGIHQAMLQNDMSQRVARTGEVGAWARAGQLPDAPLRSSLRSGVMHLTPAQAVELDAWIKEKLSCYSEPGPGTHAYEFAFLTTDLTIWQQLRKTDPPVKK